MIAKKSLILQNVTFEIGFERIEMAYSNEDIERIWQTARKVEGMDARMVRKDPCGAWIVRDKFGMSDNEYGWEVDHIYPRSLGGDDNPVNLRPMHCANNRSKGDCYPSYIVAVTSDGKENKAVRRVLKVNKAKREVLDALYNK